MSFFDDLLGRAGGALGGAAAGSALGPIGAIGGGILGALGGGGGGSRSSGGSGSGAGSDADFFAQFGALAAQANAPLTIAGSRYGQTLGAQTGALGLLARGQDEANQKLIAGAIARAIYGDQSRGAEILEATRGKLDIGQEAVKGQFGLTDKSLQGQIALNLLAPNFAAQAGSAALAGDIGLQKGIADTNLGLQALQESAKTNIATNYAKNLGDAFLVRATTEGNLATGAQRIAGDLAKLDAGIVGNLTLNKAKTESDIARTRASAAATKDLRRNAANIALTGQRYFG